MTIDRIVADGPGNCGISRTSICKVVDTDVTIFRNGVSADGGIDSCTAIVGPAEDASAVVVCNGIIVDKYRDIGIAVSINIDAVAGCITNDTIFNDNFIRILIG